MLSTCPKCRSSLSATGSVKLGSAQGQIVAICPSCGEKTPVELDLNKEKKESATPAFSRNKKVLIGVLIAVVAALIIWGNISAGP